MKLTPAQLAPFERDGYPFFPVLFTPAEVKALTGEVSRLDAMARPENVPSRHPRMIEPVEGMFGERLCMDEFKINGKPAFDGDVWQWHQDHGTWLNDDLMPTPRAMNPAILLDEANDFNGPLMFIPGNHGLGALPAGHDLSTSCPLWTIDHPATATPVEKAGGHEGGIVAAPRRRGRAGRVARRNASSCRPGRSWPACSRGTRPPRGAGAPGATWGPT